MIGAAIVTLGAGCTLGSGQGVPAADDSDTPQGYEATSSDLLSLVSDAVVIERVEEGQLVEQHRVAADEPLEAVWGNELEYIFWTEAQRSSNLLPESGAAEGYVMRSVDLDTGRRDDLYWSRQAMTDLRSSSQSKLVSFLEGDDLYVLSRETGSVERVAEGVLWYEWSPSVLEMIVQTSDDWIFVDLDSTAHVTDSFSLALAQDILGATFLDRRTVLAIVTGEEDGVRAAQLVELGVKNGSVKVVEFWRSLDELPEREAVDEEGEGRPLGALTDPAYGLWLSPTGQLVLVESYSAAGNVQGQLVYSRAHRRRTPIELPGALLAWQRDDDMILAAPTAIPQEWDLSTFAVASGDLNALGVRRSPASPLSPYTP